MSLSTLGRSHPILRRVRALRRDRAARDKEGVFLAEGPHLAEEALRASASIERAIVSPLLAEHDEGRQLLERAQRAGWELHEVSPTILDGLQDAQSPQPIVCIARRSEDGVAGLLPRVAGGGLLAVAVGVQDPGNLGALLRTADAAGATGFVSCGGADLYHPRAVRATAGSIFRLPAATSDIGSLLDALERAGVATLAAVPHGGVPHTEVPLEGPLALLVGGEGAGLPAGVVDRARARVHIPMREGVDSLSVGAAAAVLLFEFARRTAVLR